LSVFDAHIWETTKVLGLSVFDAQIESMHKLEDLSAFSLMGGSFIGPGGGAR
jgi:hypothetical protein